MRKTLLAPLVMAWVVAGTSQALAAGQSYDLFILHGRVMDPETESDGVANVGIQGGRIAVITEMEIEGNRTIDASGHVVAPGFIDLHAHGQNLGDYRMQAMQGVTTMLELESGVLPISAWYEAQARRKLPIHYGAASGWTFARISTFTGSPPAATPAYFQDAQSRTDWKLEIATPEQQQNILRLVEEGLDQGALGIGINAGYAPGYGEKEYYALARRLAGTAGSRVVGVWPWRREGSGSTAPRAVAGAGIQRGTSFSSSDPFVFEGLWPEIAGSRPVPTRHNYSGSLRNSRSGGAWFRSLAALGCGQRVGLQPASPTGHSARRSAIQAMVRAVASVRSWGQWSSAPL